MGRGAAGGGGGGARGGSTGGSGNGVGGGDARAATAQAAAAARAAAATAAAATAVARVRRRRNGAQRFVCAVRGSWPASLRLLQRTLIRPFALQRTKFLACEPQACVDPARKP